MNTKAKNTDQVEICILAAGMGSRMKSDKPKVLHTLAGQPLLGHLVKTVQKIRPQRIHVVIGKGAAQVEQAFSDSGLNWVYQREQMGTGHAVMQALPGISADSRVLILLGDAPLIKLATVQKLISAECDLGILTVNLDNPFNYGRIVRGAGEQVLAIVEEKDATEDQRKIGEINSGVMITTGSLLTDWLSRIDTDNVQGEYLLTDIVGLANQDGCKVSAIVTDDPLEASGINNFSQLAKLEREYQMSRAEELMEAGVHVIDPTRIDIRGNLTVGKNVRIDINCIFEGDVSLGDNVTVSSNCVIKDSTIAEGSLIKPNSMLDEATVGKNCTVGPFARLRPGAHLMNSVSVGNFVEIKKTTLGDGAKAPHLSYLGDAEIGANVNIGAGTITCNYDGVNKHKTEIADNVFVGSNSSLVAPVKIGAGATIGAGSTITHEVEAGLAIARGRQKVFANWKGPRDKK
ncbi:MAG: bifunctional UDP-N-acetylglucosamine pyrophosphorylase/glucosamine-1-phosphate N-acetyltransferase [Candidatus Azotimanducaceae bacterium]|jgi:bifunctional UDP-N-acetylglucosamine pyrophosphorylase/glucosamine-1-phosphate N-acetyltransferase